ncbi:conserved membrane hypothetical protein [Tenacibaculum sp. 190524A05c]|uniref:DoxX family protein n=1 Tax=Tenacibaculum platacis TaxID=3137852 RepID=UPI0031FB8612
MKKLYLAVIAILFSLSISGQTINVISRDWAPFSQNIEVNVDTIKKFKLIAFAKVETTDKKAKTGLWARVDNKEGKGRRGFFDNMSDRPITSNKWKSYTIQGVIDQDSKKLNFGGICYNNGKFYFDKFELYIEDDNGEYQPIAIKNSSFEAKIEDQTIPEWNMGISKGKPYRVKEFSISSSNDSEDGQYSLLIEGSGISEKTGSIAGIGKFIVFIYLIVLVFSLMTKLSPSKSENSWSKSSLIAFRFSFVYFLLFIIIHNNGAYVFFDYIMKYPNDLLHQFIPWVGKHILHLPYDITTFTNGSGDTTYDYVLMFLAFFIAVVSTVVWTLVDKKNKNYDKLYYWLTTAVRYYVGLMLIHYGLVKVIQLQFPQPSFYRLFQPYGESSPMGLAWTFLGFSKGYNLFMGIAEVLAGLLLFRRTLAFGAIITLMTALNVMAVNYFYDVPVKLLSTHLVLMTIFLLSRDIKKLCIFLFTNKTIEGLTTIKRPKFNKSINISLLVIKAFILTYALGYGFYNALQSKKIYGSDAPKSKLYGAYKITDYVVNGDTITNYKSKILWKTLVFEREGYVQVRKMDKQRISYKTEIDTINHKIELTPYRGKSDAFTLNYTKNGDKLDFNYIHKKDTVFGKTEKLGKDDFLLINRGFHWISEYPYNR